MNQHVPTSYAVRVEPPLAPEDKPSPAALARLANRLLRELSRDDPQIAMRLRELGLEPLSAPPRR